MIELDTNNIIASAIIVTATGVIVMIYQSWISAKNLTEFKKNSQYEKDKSKKTQAIKELKEWDEFLSQSQKMIFSIYIAMSLSKYDTKKLINNEKVIIDESLYQYVEGIFKNKHDYTSFDETGGSGSNLRLSMNVYTKFHLIDE